MVSFRASVMLYFLRENLEFSPRGFRASMSLRRSIEEFKIVIFLMGGKKFRIVRNVFELFMAGKIA